jgi:hypothetical protein
MNQSMPRIQGQDIPRPTSSRLFAGLLVMGKDLKKAPE